MGREVKLWFTSVEGKKGDIFWMSHNMKTTIWQTCSPDYIWLLIGADQTSAQAVLWLQELVVWTHPFAISVWMPLEWDCMTERKWSTLLSDKNGERLHLATGNVAKCTGVLSISGSTSLARSCESIKKTKHKQLVNTVIAANNTKLLKCIKLYMIGCIF